MKKIYCINCKFCRITSDCYGGVYYNCKHPSNIKMVHEPHYNYKACKEETIKLNAKNNCKNYEKWRWKFWIKEGKNNGS